MENERQSAASAPQRQCRAAMHSARLLPQRNTSATLVSGVIAYFLINITNNGLQLLPDWAQCVASTGQIQIFQGLIGFFWLGTAFDF
jgi:hypothetical protein